MIYKKTCLREWIPTIFGKSSKIMWNNILILGLDTVGNIFIWGERSP